MLKIYALILTLVTLSFAGCASQQSSATNDNQSSPMNRNNSNGLASYMH